MIAGIDAFGPSLIVNPGNVGNLGNAYVCTRAT
jgi:Icc-related predicted phosphoesterase